jgi:hypothetical protein
MKMLKLILILFLGICFACNGPNEESANTEEMAIDSSHYGSDSIVNFGHEDNFSEIEVDYSTEFLDAEIVEFKKTLGDLDVKNTKSNFKELVEDISNCNLPTQISNLNQGSNIKIFKFDSKKQAEAKLFGFGGSIGKNEMLLIQEFARYGTFSCDGKREKFGIGLRCFIHIKSIKSKLDIDKLSAVAAHVELGNLNATYELISVGFPMEGDMLVQNLPPIGDYNVDNFGKLSATFQNILKTLNSNNNMPIEPVSMPYYN